MARTPRPLTDAEARAYPRRRATQRHGRPAPYRCLRCRRPIRNGHEYYDGGGRGRVHVSCVGAG